MGLNDQDGDERKRMDKTARASGEGESEGGGTMKQ